MVHITTQILLLLTLMSYILVIITMFLQNAIMIEWDIINFNSMDISMPIIIDTTSTLFMSTVLSIACSVMQFSKTYMSNDKTKDRFVILVILFVLSMMFLILFPHTITLLLGWDGLGITSFVLVIYYNNAKSLGAGMITALTNRIGDVMLLIAIALMFNQGQWTITVMWPNGSCWWVYLMILIAAMTKSAQMPFSSWLPAAMAAPTPVSALVHSSTLVTAGVYLLYRFYPMMEKATLFSPILLMMATLTMLMASASAMVECDMKKIIALSTLSQVALMMFTLSLNMPEIAFFHLITHALFKALLFICAGNMIDIHHHSQDLRTMGNTVTQLPSISVAISVANLALCGAPFMAGFYSKDLIIESASMLTSEKNIMIMIMFMIATILTTAYSTRFSIYVLLTPTYSPSTQYSMENMTQSLSIIVLTTMAIVGGAMVNWLYNTPVIEPNFISGYKFVAPCMVMSGVMMGATTSMVLNFPSNSILTNSHCLMWFLTPISSHFLSNILMKLPLLTLKEIDQGWSLLPLMFFFKMKEVSLMVINAQDKVLMSFVGCVGMIMLWIIMTI
uniref:NADH-ubiquinone oxidoreductase chain 5 n=1 Tax=Platynereis bicanaliculata TaxID=868042 RepID=A0A7G8JTM4_9ANNE|nr:NADH dehydrogenase subunit 5 [Platynereis bicanaliculata]QNJ33922.1 NADH dehydrogenase subunit 5 [Platynereis bicanaliculata]